MRRISWFLADRIRHTQNRLDDLANQLLTEDESKPPGWTFKRRLAQGLKGPLRWRWLRTLEYRLNFWQSYKAHETGLVETLAELARDGY